MRVIEVLDHLAAYKHNMVYQNMKRKSKQTPEAKIGVAFAKCMFFNEMRMN